MMWSASVDVLVQVCVLVVWHWGHPSHVHCVSRLRMCCRMRGGNPFEVLPVQVIGGVCWGVGCGMMGGWTEFVLVGWR